MMGEALKVMSLSKIEDRVEPDASCDFNYILGDLNARFKSTYCQHIANVMHSAELIPELDEMYEMRFKHQLYPGYKEGAINFLPTYKCNQ